MGFLGDLIDDVLDIPGKVIEAPFRIMDRALCLGDHEWRYVQGPRGRVVRECIECGAVEQR